MNHGSSALLLGAVLLSLLVSVQTDTLSLLVSVQTDTRECHSRSERCQALGEIQGAR